MQACLLRRVLQVVLVLLIVTLVVFTVMRLSPDGRDV